MSHMKYLGYLALTVAVLLDLYAGNPADDAHVRITLDMIALVVAVAGLGSLAAGPMAGIRR